MKEVHMAAYLLTVVGALNWGLIGLFDFNLVNLVLGSLPALERLVYILVGLSAAYILATHKDNCKVCAGKSGK